MVRWNGRSKVRVGIRVGYWIGEDRTMTQHILLQEHRGTSDLSKIAMFA